MKFEKYFKAVKYLESIRKKANADYFVKKSGRSLFLNRTQYFLDQLGNPERNFKFIHVAGSTGKGSVATMIHQILVEDGKKAGLHTSPHPSTTIEKIKVGNLYISPNDFIKLVEKVKPIITKTQKQFPNLRPSYFEIFMGISLLYFKQQKCEYVVLEVGLGGRYDATNVIKKAEATIINVIDLDHTEILGETLAKIASEKAGIIKPNTNAYTTNANSREVLNIFKMACRKAKVPLHIIRPPKSPFKLQLLGKNQQSNAAIAAAVATKLKISKTSINKGLSKVKLSCRFEIIQTKPTVILDLAHNESKINSVVKNLRNLTYNNLYLIIALTSERQPAKVFHSLKSLANYTYITRFMTGVPARKVFKPAQLAKQIKGASPLLTPPPATLRVAKRAGRLENKKSKTSRFTRSTSSIYFKNNIKVVQNPHQALTQALRRATNDDIILITGSIFLAGDLRKHWTSEKKILTTRKSF